jgi:hypothetical protein
MALLASFVSIRVGVSVALVEILAGAIFDNIPGIKEHDQQTDHTTLLAGVGSVSLTFRAGAEIDPVSLRRHWRASLSMGAVSFVLPLVGAFCFSRYLFHWNLHASDRRGGRRQARDARRRGHRTASSGARHAGGTRRPRARSVTTPSRGMLGRWRASTKTTSASPGPRTIASRRAISSVR